MFMWYPTQQQTGVMPVPVAYPQLYVPQGSSLYPAQSHGGLFDGTGMPLGALTGVAPAPFSFSGCLAHPAPSVYFFMEAGKYSATPAPSADALACCATPPIKLTRSQSGNSLSMQSCSSGGETRSILSRSTPSSTPASTTRLRRLHDVNVWGFALVDQLHLSSQRIPVPPSCVVEATMAIGLYDNDVISSSIRPCKSSVCLLHAQGLGCAEGARCRCFHVSPTYLAQCRATFEPLCCSLHNCYYSQEMLNSNSAPHVTARKYKLSLDDASIFPQDGDEPYLISLSLLNVSLTVGLETLPCVDGVCTVSWKKHVCRLNVDGLCKWTKDCGHIHVCSRLTKLLRDAEILAVMKALQTNSQTKCTADLYRDIILSESALRYVRSPLALPLVTELIEADDVIALRAMARAKCALLPSQKEELMRLTIPLSGGEAIRSDSLSPRVTTLLSPRLCKCM